jgi:uncharacterized damage-inducible protein DinB
MNADMMRALYGYNSWATRQVLFAAVGLEGDAWATLGIGQGRTLRETLVHLVASQRAWVAWLDGSLSLEEAYALSLSPEDFPDVASLLAVWDEVDVAMDDFLDGLVDDDVQRTYQTEMQGITFGQELWQYLLHIANHATQHRSEAAVMLTEAGASPGGLDMMWFFLAQSMPAPGSQPKGDADAGA